MRITPVPTDLMPRPTADRAGSRPIPAAPGFLELLDAIRTQAETTAPSPASQPVTHTVARGENLWQICRNCLAAQGEKPSNAEILAAVQQVGRANALKNPNLIIAGRELDLSVLRPEQAAVEPAVPIAPVITGKTEQVPMPAPSAPASGPEDGPRRLPEAPPPRLSSAAPAQGPSARQGPVSQPSATRPHDITALIQSILERDSAEHGAPALERPWAHLIAGPARLTSSYGMRPDPFTGKPEFHHGIDIAAKAGTKVYPYLPGKVTFSGWQAGHGKVVVVEHADGLETLYGHASKNLVKVGQVVGPETPITLVGSTGRSTAPHLHFEMRRNDRSIDPVPVVADNSLHVAKTF